MTSLKKFGARKQVKVLVRALFHTIRAAAMEAMGCLLRLRYSPWPFGGTVAKKDSMSDRGRKVPAEFKKDDGPQLYPEERERALDWSHSR